MHVSERVKIGVIVAGLMALINIGTILYAAGVKDGVVNSRLMAIEERLMRIERILDTQFGR